jgi:predicted metalloprotease
MRWQGRKESNNIEDRRGLSPRGVVGGGLGTIAVVVIILLLGGNPSDLLQNITTNQQITASSDYVETERDKELAQFVSVVLAETETVWKEVFNENGQHYVEPKLVLYSGSVQSACGFSSAATGPFYCPGDEKVYIDLSFYDELQNKFKAPGDFAMAYVIAHEIGHHIQKLLGISEQVSKLRNQLNEEEYNKYSVRLELQADFLAGIWAHYEEKMGDVIEVGDIDEALTAASSVGDDRIQKEMQGYVVPESFTHGTSAQRKKWFYKGYRSGDLKDGDTFSANDL